VNEGVIGGTAYDGYLQAPVSGVKVSLCPSGGGLTDALASTTTDANGAYGFSGVGPSSYTLYFEDPAGRFLPQWYDYQVDSGKADWITVDAPGAYQVDVFLDGVGTQHQTVFSATTIASSDGLFWAGRPMTLQANLFDAISNAPLDSLPVTVQSSVDRRVWETIGSASPHPVDRGSYVFTHVPLDYTPRYFRLCVATSEDFLGSISTEVRWSPALPSGVWETVLCNGAPVSSLRTGAKTFVLAGTLRDKDGRLNRDDYVFVEQSLDGVTWFPATATVSQPTPGGYEAKVQTGKGRMYRLSAQSRRSGVARVTSSITAVVAPRYVLCGAVGHGKKLYMMGQCWPMAQTARIVVQRRVRGKWRPCAVYRPSIKNSGNRRESFMQTGTRLRRRGTYRVRMSVPAAPGFLPGTSAWEEFKIR
jgi:hypothetical protein